MEFPYFIHLITLIAIYGIVTMSFTLALGYGGVVNFAHIAIMGIGAYTSAILTTRYAFPWFVGIMGAIIVSALVSALLSVLLRRVRGDFMGLIALALALAAYELFANLDITRGALGIFGIPRPAVFLTPPHFAVAVLVVFGLAAFIMFRIVRSPFGRVLGATRDDALSARVLGKDVTHVQRTVLIVSGAMAGLAGALLASFIGYIDPQSFYLVDLLAVVAAAIIGGVGSLAGSVLGVALYLLLPEVLRLLPFDADNVGALRMIIFALLLLMIILFRPKGLLGKIELE